MLSFDGHNKQVCKMFLRSSTSSRRLEDLENGFGKCVNSVIFSAHSVSVFLLLSANCESFGEEVFIVGQK